MKFTKEQAVEALRAELTNKGRKTQHMFDRTLANLTEILVKKFANEDTGLPDFVTDMMEIFNEVEGDARKKDKEYYIVCQSGGRSSMVCSELTNKGYDVVNVAGGVGSYIGSNRS